MLLTTPAFDILDFTWDGMHGITDISDLGRENVFGQVFDDACDVGFTVVNCRTGNSVKFVVHSTSQWEGELMAWTLVPAEHADRLAFPFLRITLVND